MDQVSCRPVWLGWVLTSPDLQSLPSAVEQLPHTGRTKRSLCTAVVGLLGGLLRQCGERRLSGTAVSAA